MKMSEPWVIAYFGAAVAILLGLFAAVTTFMTYRRQRSDDTERALGRLEGRGGRIYNDDNGAGRMGGNIMEAIGGLKAQVVDIRDDIIEIKTIQKDNREAQVKEFSTLKDTVNTRITGVSDDLKKLWREFHAARPHLGD
jgi:preprotein translocase subunit YajC